MKQEVLIFSLLYLTPIFLFSQFADQLPANVQSSILWLGDHEEGNLSDWTMDGFQYAGGGIFNTGGTEVQVISDTQCAHSGNYSAKARISNAFQSANGSRAIRLMRWTDTAWDNGGEYFPDESYFSAFYYFPFHYNPNKYQPWDPGDGGWWNIFQFKSDDVSEESQPIWTLNVDHNDATGHMSLYLYTKYNSPASVAQAGTAKELPVNRWVHLEAFYRSSTPGLADGEIRIWQDGEEILAAQNVVTILDGNVVWGIGNYTDHIDGGEVEGQADIYFDDCIVSTTPIHPYVPIDCVEKTYIRSHLIDPDTYASENQILSDGKVNSGDEVNMFSNTIILDAGFEAESGSTLYIVNDPCGNP